MKKYILFLFFITSGIKSFAAPDSASILLVLTIHRLLAIFT